MSPTSAPFCSVLDTVQIQCQDTFVQKMLKSAAALIQQEQVLASDNDGWGGSNNSSNGNGSDGVNSAPSQATRKASGDTGGQVSENGLLDLSSGSDLRDSCGKDTNSCLQVDESSPVGFRYTSTLAAAKTAAPPAPLSQLQRNQKLSGSKRHHEHTSQHVVLPQPSTRLAVLAHAIQPCPTRGLHEQQHQGVAVASTDSEVTAGAAVVSLAHALGQKNTWQSLLAPSLGKSDSGLGAGIEGSGQAPDLPLLLDDDLNHVAGDHNHVAAAQTNSREEGGSSQVQGGLAAAGSCPVGQDGCGSADGDSAAARASKRMRLVWTPELHHRFMASVHQLGVNHAVPKHLLQLMNVEGMTRENVASHLQKYRLYLKKLSGVSGNDPIPEHILVQAQEQSLHQYAVKNQVAAQHMATMQLQQQHQHAAAAMQQQQQQQQQALLQQQQMSAMGYGVGSGYGMPPAACGGPSAPGMSQNTSGPASCPSGQFQAPGGLMAPPAGPAGPSAFPPPGSLGAPGSFSNVGACPSGESNNASMMQQVMMLQMQQQQMAQYNALMQQQMMQAAAIGGAPSYCGGPSMSFPGPPMSARPDGMQSMQFPSMPSPAPSQSMGQQQFPPGLGPLGQQQQAMYQQQQQQAMHQQPSREEQQMQQQADGQQQMQMQAFMQQQQMAQMQQQQQHQQQAHFAHMQQQQQQQFAQMQQEQFNARTQQQQYSQSVNA